MKLLSLLASTHRGAISAGGIITLVIGFLLFGLLAPVALGAIESYIPTDPTLAIIWPLCAVLFVLGVAMRYIPRGKD